MPLPWRDLSAKSHPSAAFFVAPDFFLHLPD
jgi:hypothetical protein